MRPDNNHVKKAAQHMELIKMAVLDLLELGITPTTIRLGKTPTIHVLGDSAVNQFPSYWTGQVIEHHERFVTFAAVHCGVKVTWRKRIPSRVIDWSDIKSEVVNG